MFPAMLYNASHLGGEDMAIDGECMVGAPLIAAQNHSRRGRLGHDVAVVVVQARAVGREAKTRTERFTVCPVEREAPTAIGEAKGIALHLP